MSDAPLRIAIAAEGPSDFEIIQSAIAAMLSDAPFVPTLVQPDGSVAFSGGGDAGLHGGGWKGVGRWCRQSALRGGGRLTGDVVLDTFDIVVIHLDADVASESSEEFDGLPCQQPCPPARDTTDALRQAMLLWMGESGEPRGLIFCTPSKSIEAWVMEAFFPSDSEWNRQGKECHPKPETRLPQQPKLVRFAKADYRRKAPEFGQAWPRVARNLPEAARFQADFQKALAPKGQ